MADVLGPIDADAPLSRFQAVFGTGLRYVFEWRGQWLSLAGWQTGAFKSAPRDRWVGWKGKIRYERLHLIGNNTRFLALGAPGVFANLASMALSAMTRRLSNDWFEAYGHGLLLAESSVDPSRFEGSMYRASNWTNLGKTKGYPAAGDNIPTRTANSRTCMYGRCGPMPGKCCATRYCRHRLRPVRGAGMKPVQMRTLYEERLQVEDFRRPQGRKHTMASTIATHILARISGFVGFAEAAQFTRSLTQKELQALGAWCNPRTGRYEAVSKSTLHRVLQQADPEALEAVLRRYSAPRLQVGKAVAADGKRVRAANRHSADHYESITLVEHGTGQPVNSLTIHDESGEHAAVHALLESVEVRGRVITVDALHTVRSLARSIVEAYQADYLMTVQGNAADTHQQLSTVRWDEQSTGSWTSDVEMEHGRIEQRSIQTLVPPKKMDQLSPCGPGLSHPATAPGCERRYAQRGSGLWHHVGAAGTGGSRAVARMEPGPLGRRESQPSSSGRTLLGRCLSRTHRSWAREPCPVQ
ncbi:MAG: ISAs1 family transposase [Gammaproteobacteria bacterium]|nr:ISAs1 family transposase [Gammaproteobacteria bacterium]